MKTDRPAHRLLMAVFAGCLALHCSLQHAAEPVTTDGKTKADVKRKIESITIGDKKIEAERYLPSGEGKHPAIIILHGAEGRLIDRFVHIYQNMAQEAAEHGYVAYTVQYFDRTDTKMADPLTMVKEFSTWSDTIKEAITYVGKQPEVDADRIALEGVSLGSYLSLWTASQDERVKCVVEYFGGMPPILVGQVKRMPPVLILHGEKDPLVKVEEAHHLEKVFKDKQVDYEIKLYPNQGHGFFGADAKDAGVRAIEFFDKYLKAAK